MGVRLYPILKKDVTIAQFIGNDDPEAIDAFDTYGFGKFNPCQYQMDGEHILDSGSSKNPVDYETTILLNFASGRFNYPQKDARELLKLIDGVMWC